MATGTDRQQRVAASFTCQYYTRLVQEPEKLIYFYTQHASFNHMGHKATGAAEIEEVMARLYPTQAGASVKIQRLTSLTDEDGHIHVSIKGSITNPPGVSQEFTHEVELMEHTSHPGNFGIVFDKRENAISGEAPRRWALETPPMFAAEPAADTMERIEQPAPTTVVATVEHSTAREDVKTPEKTESAALVKVATTVPAAAPATLADTITDATSQTQASKDVEKTTATTDPAVPAPVIEVKKPKSFAEAIMVSKCGGSLQSRTTPLMVLAKETKDPSALGQAKDKKGAVVHPVKKQANKAAPKNGADKNKTTGVSLPGDGGKKTGKTLTAGRNSKDHNNNDVNAKRKDADGRPLSRFVVFYDIIVKGLPTDATEQTVRDIVEPIAPTKLIKVLTRNDKNDSSVVRTFAFVQLDHNAIKEKGDDVKATVAKVLADHKGKKTVAGYRIQIDEVREKYTAAPNDAAVDASV
ncbi:mucin-associated surface protein (MASP) [Trypanosoma rangeli]|uniref:Mucin-associated surface protein (MASP) n=1 Tax=Trypanosoma rangeli TaxID=5698 RepID=A0A422NWQ6_TRYRA|nr:mucin-associated surface protein (MASP) [Trypanosoma rangeli]RNF09866.1 mucin-associated surface protein (MASP) [Trypanosoma rangeli]|eukprot:RNF09866.1 mucin-associated surface protein (MASP) [Trypanosoma rangeli]